MMRKIKPHKQLVLVEPITPTCDARAFIIPEAFRDKSTEGIVIEVGTSMPPGSEMKVGDRVLFERHGGTEIENDGRKFKLLSPNEILAVIEQTNE